MKRILATVLLAFGLCFLSTVGALSDELPQEIPLVHTATDQSSLFVHLPPPEKRNGAAVIICPGGGYSMVSLNNEGHDVAQWFNEQGVAGFVLKYRLPGKNSNPATVVLEDAKAAMRQVHEHASKWGIDPHRVRWSARRVSRRLSHWTLRTLREKLMKMSAKVCNRTKTTTKRNVGHCPQKSLKNSL